jgi:hypothetical protein
MGSMGDFVTILGVAWVGMGLIIPFYIQYARDSLIKALEEKKRWCPYKRGIPDEDEKRINSISLYFMACDIVTYNAIATVGSLSISATLAFIFFSTKKPCAFYAFGIANFILVCFIAHRFQQSRKNFAKKFCRYKVFLRVFSILYLALTFIFYVDFLKWLWITVIFWTLFYLCWIFYYGEKYKPTYNMAALMGENLIKPGRFRNIF